MAIRRGDADSQTHCADGSSRGSDYQRGVSGIPTGLLVEGGQDPGVPRVTGGSTGTENESDRGHAPMVAHSRAVAGIGGSDPEWGVGSLPFGR